MKFIYLISIHNIHWDYSYSYSYDDIFPVENILIEESVLHLHNNDVFWWENFFNKVAICHRLTGITNQYSLSDNHNSLHRRRGYRCCVFNKDNVHIGITRSKEWWRDMVRLLSKKVESGTHKNTIYLSKNKTSLNWSNELSYFIYR